MTARPVRDAENELVERVQRISAATTNAENKAIYESSARDVNEWQKRIQQDPEVAAFVKVETVTTYNFLTTILLYAVLPAAVIVTVLASAGIAILIWRLINV